MAHLRRRYLVEALTKALKFSPIVGILGQRQTGKTTLLQETVKENYVSLDDFEELQAARLNPKGFLEKRSHPFGVDECQLAPELFPALKLQVQDNKRPGRFILTGSIRFTSRKAVRESLTGRIFNLELLPMTISEGKNLPLGDLFAMVRKPRALLDEAVRNRLKVIQARDLEDFRLKGGLPGISFLRDKAVRRAKFGAHLETILERDLKLLVPTTLPFASLRRLLAILAQHQGLPMPLSSLSRLSRISVPTLKRLLSAFESMFLIRRILPIGDRKNEVFYLEDLGMASFLSDTVDPYQNVLALAFTQIFAQLRYHFPADGECLTYETRGGASLPLVFKGGGKTLGCIPVLGETADRSALLSAKSFLRRWPEAWVVILTKGSSASLLGKRTVILPLRAAI